MPLMLGGIDQLLQFHHGLDDVRGDHATCMAHCVTEEVRRSSVEVIQHGMGREGGLGDVGPHIDVTGWVRSLCTLSKILDVLLCEPGIVDVRRCPIDVADCDRGTGGAHAGRQRNSTARDVLCTCP